MAHLQTTASFGYWVRRQRLALDLTQAALARNVGCATITVSKIERDERRPSRQMAGLLAQSLAIPEDDRDLFLSVALGERAVDGFPLAGAPVESEPTVEGAGDADARLWLGARSRLAPNSELTSAGKWTEKARQVTDKTTRAKKNVVRPALRR